MSRPGVEVIPLPDGWKPTQIVPPRFTHKAWTVTIGPAGAHWWSNQVHPFLRDQIEDVRALLAFLEWVEADRRAQANPAPPAPPAPEPDDDTPIQCVKDGVTLTGYQVDDGARHWVWAIDEDDARRQVALSFLGGPEDGLEARYEAAIGWKLADAAADPLTGKRLRGVKFTTEGGTQVSMAAAMMTCRYRGLVASTEF